MEQTPIILIDANTHSNKNLKWVVLAVFVVLMSVWISVPPRKMEVGTVVRVEEGEALSSVAKKLYEGNYIRSTAFFETLVMLIPGKSHIVYGDYYFDKRVPVWTVASRMVRGLYNISQVRVTMWEGMTIREISKLLGSTIDSIDSNDFQEKANGLEGYLFPDTYFISPFATAEDVIETMQNNFDKKTRSLEQDIIDSGHTKKEIIIMASIIEKESNGKGDRATISGILWNRIAIGQALQVDASFIYLLGKESSELTLLDLQTDSPYNTYTHKGLPPGPIGNPGLDSIVAAIHPEQTEYMFYLHGKDGTLYPAKTFADHIKNKQKYLR